MQILVQVMLRGSWCLHGSWHQWNPWSKLHDFFKSLIFRLLLLHYNSLLIWLLFNCMLLQHQKYPNWMWLLYQNNPKIINTLLHYVISKIIKYSKTRDSLCNLHISSQLHHITCLLLNLQFNGGIHTVAFFTWL